MAKESSGGGVVKAGAVVIQFEFGEVFAGGELVAVGEGGVGGGEGEAEGVVGEGGAEGAGGIGEVADGAQVVGEVEGGAIGGTEAGEELVGGVAEQVTGGGGVGGVEIGPHVGTIVNEVGKLAVDGLGDTAVKQVVSEADFAEQNAAGSVGFGGSQAVAVVVGVSGKGAGRPLGFGKQIPFGIVAVIVSFVGQQLIVIADHDAGIVPISVQIVSIIFIRKGRTIRRR